MSTSAERVAYISKHFMLKETPEGWEALWTRPDGSTFDRRAASTREETCRLARVWWGHFNFDDEAQAFAEIFR